MYATLFSENLVKSTADAMASQGFVDAGYQYLVIDDCWMDENRDSKGRLQADVRRFPSGMAALSAYVRSRSQSEDRSRSVIRLVVVSNRLVVAVAYSTVYHLLICEQRN